jgi:mono/diheme cytochrome c family protein
MLRTVVMVGILAGTTASAWAQDARAAAEKIYADQKCGVCHSIAGKGNQKGALDDVGSRLTAEEIRMWLVDAKAMTAKTKAERKPPMRNYSLPKDQLDTLVGYLASLKKK